MLQAWQWLKKAVIAMLVACALLLVIPVSWGGWAQLTVITGTSMEPTYHDGDIVLTWRTENYHVGDAIVYHPESIKCARCNIVHRIVDVNSDGSYVTQGDNNGSIDPWQPHNNEVIGEEVLVLGLGDLSPWVMNRWLWVFIFTLTGSLWLAVWIYEEYKQGSREGNRGDTA